MTENELYHYGIKGMKWGVRRYQNKDGSLTAKGRQHYSSGNRNADSKVGMSDEMVMLVYNTSAALVTYGVLTLAAKASKHRGIDKCNKRLDSQYEHRTYNTFNDVPKLKTKKSAAENMKEVNPDFPNLGTTMNCMYCTTAMALREKGYDVKANTSPDGLWQENYNRVWDSSGQFKKLKAKNGKALVDTLSSEGDGAYGNLTINWKMGGAHSVFWKNEGGKTHIYDGQSGTEYDVSNPDYSPLFNKIYTNQSQYARLDNAKPNDLILGMIK